MADAADMSDDKIEAQIAEGVAKARNRPRLKPKGTCYACCDPVPADLLFCPDEECAADYEYFEAAARRKGWA